MKRNFYAYTFILLLGGVGFAAWHQAGWVPAFGQLNEEVLRRGRAYETLAEASRTVGHRLTGSSNGYRAEQYAHDLLKSYGFAQVRYQPFSVEAWTRDTVTLAIAPRKSDNFRDVPVVSLAHSPVEANVSADLIDVGNGLEGDFIENRERIKGRVVLVNIGLLPPYKGSRNLHRSEKTALAIQYGAAGVVMVNTVPGQVLLTGTASVTGSLIPIPSVCVSLETGQEIRAWMKEEKLMALVDMKNHSRVINARNVIAMVKGQTREKIVVGGHLDSWDLATGAIDNGIGSFSVLDLARTFRALKIKPRRTIEFVLFMGEEQGLLGSKAYINEAKAKRQLDRIRYMVNLDMTNNPRGFNASGRDEMVAFIDDLGRQIQRVDPAFANVNSNQAGLHSDHQPFLLEGIPTLTPSGSLAPNVLNCYHADCDRLDLVNKTELQNTVRYTAMLVYALANAPTLPAQRLGDTATRDFLAKQGLKNALIIGKEWRWPEPGESNAK
jgi:carboxypeptidase Q